MLTSGQIEGMVVLNELQPETTASQKRILLMEGDPILQGTLLACLQERGYAVECAGDLEEGLMKAQGNDHDLLIVNLMMKRHEQCDIGRMLAGWRFQRPFLMIAEAHDANGNASRVLIGSDDYVAHPLQLDVLLQKVSAMLGEAPGAGAPAQRWLLGNVTVDMARMEVLKEGKPVRLSPKEFQLLCYLLQQRGKPVSRATLLEAVWGGGIRQTSRTVDVHVAWLRQKLELDPRQPSLIVTVHGLGYRIGVAA